MIEAIILAVAQLLGAVAPEIARAFTGGRSVAEAVAAARSAAEALPEREVSGRDPDAGTWDEDLAERLRRG